MTDQAPDHPGGDTAKILSITGHVQGVFFRNWSQTQAEELGVLGWIRNRQDGSVEVFVQGAEDAVTAFVAAVRTGPESAEVGAVLVAPAAPRELSRFEVMPDA